jgi:cytochrome P450
MLFDPDVYKNPYHFDPDRWLDNANSFDEKRYYIPFGKGGRSCPSKEYVYQLIAMRLFTFVANA